MDIDLQALTRNLAGEKRRCAKQRRREDNEVFHGARSSPQKEAPIVIFGGDGLRAHMDIAITWCHGARRMRCRGYNLPSLMRGSPNT